jgi:mannose-1-phosphate guanylyltransferase
VKAVIMAGGQGARFWPVSREEKPKQFLEIGGSGTMLQETAARFQPLLSAEDVYVVCGQRYVQQVREQLEQLQEDQVIVEPSARNTAPCIGLAALYLRRQFPDEVMSVFPSDHVIQDVAEFHQALQAAGELAKEGWLVTFGIQPSYAATGYGYVQKGDPLGEFGGCAAYEVAGFTEKPDRSRAQQFLKEGDYCWNSGMFVWSIENILTEMERHMPDLYRALMEIDGNWEDSAGMERIYSGLEKTSIDVGVMEKAEKIAVIPCALGWSDVGNWRALEQVESSDEQGVTSNSPHVNIDSRDTVLYTSEGKLVALVGVEDLVVVDSPDALLVCARERIEEVKQVVEQLKKQGWDKYL